MQASYSAWCLGAFHTRRGRWPDLFMLHGLCMEGAAYCSMQQNELEGGATHTELVLYLGKGNTREMY